jgi:hypothetical protein
LQTHWEQLFDCGTNELGQQALDAINASSQYITYTLSA